MRFLLYHRSSAIDSSPHFIQVLTKNIQHLFTIKISCHLIIKCDFIIFYFLFLRICFNKKNSLNPNHVANLLFLIFFSIDCSCYYPPTKNKPEKLRKSYSNRKICSIFFFWYFVGVFYYCWFSMKWSHSQNAVITNNRDYFKYCTSRIENFVIVYGDKRDQNNWSTEFSAMLHLFVSPIYCSSCKIHIVWKTPKLLEKSSWIFEWIYSTQQQSMLIDSL